MFNKPAPKTVSVRNGKIWSPARNEWLGDQAGFEAFQRYDHTRAIGAVTSVFEAPQLVSILQSERHKQNLTFPMLGSLRYVMIDPSIVTVFGHAVGLNNVDGEFTYRPYTFVLTERHFSIALPVPFVKRIASERDELRTYAASCFVTGANFDIRAVAYHFVHGKLTYMYWGIRGKPLSNTRVVVGKNIAEFMEETKAEFNVEWSGTLQLRTPPPPEYGIPLDKWRMGTDTKRQ
jgi:hypothetical protein